MTDNAKSEGGSVSSSKIMSEGAGGAPAKTDEITALQDSIGTCQQQESSSLYYSVCGVHVFIIENTCYSLLFLYRSVRMNLMGHFSARFECACILTHSFLPTCM